MDTLLTAVEILASVVIEFGLMILALSLIDASNGRDK